MAWLLLLLFVTGLAFGLPLQWAADHLQAVSSGRKGSQDGREDGEPRGASVCRERTGSPSERAPGQNK